MSLVALTVTARLALRPRRVVVEGVSMVPTLAPGDRLFVARVRPLRAGQVVVLRDPHDHSRLLCKRIVSVEGRHVAVRGDNAWASVDSGRYGPVPRSHVVGQVIRRYAPKGRAGPVR